MNTVTMHGKPLHLEGSLPEINEPAPDFALVDNGLQTVNLSHFSGKILVLVTVPSLDTPVCDVEIRRFNEEAERCSENVCIVAVSCDLPFAQARWCGNAGVRTVSSLSDYKTVEFGRTYGILLSELRLLARAVFIVNPDGRLVYRQVVPELGDEPDYAAVLKAIKDI